MITALILLAVLAVLVALLAYLTVVGRRLRTRDDHRPH